MTDSSPPYRRVSVDRVLLVAAVAQLGALFTPAARVRILGTMPFIRLPNAGVALAVLGGLALLAAFAPRARLRWVPGALAALVLAVVYWRLKWSPAGSFVDPVLRRAVRPAWGFIPMGGAVLLNLIGAVRRPRSHL